MTGSCGQKERTKTPPNGVRQVSFDRLGALERHEGEDPKKD
jgi:hypothetical protein